MLKPMDKLTNCNTCDYWYEKGEVKGCIFPNHAPIDSMYQCTCNMGDMYDTEIDEDFVKIRNLAEINIMKCSSCKHWEFPTLAVHQNLATKGICSELKIKDGTPPDFSCGKYEFELKDAKFKRAAEMAGQAGGIKKMSDTMNKDASIDDLQKYINEIAANTEFTPAGGKPSSDGHAKIGEMYYVEYSEPMEFVAKNVDDNGVVVEIVFKKSNGKLLVVGTTECNVKRPR